MTAKPANPIPRPKRKKAVATQEPASADELARIMTREGFDQSLVQEWDRAQREQQQLSLIIIDVDQFRAYKEAYATPMGDECLSRIAAVLVRAVFRPTDLLARYGSDEFAILLPTVHEGGARVVAARLRSLVNELAIPHRGGEGGIVTVSIGVAALHPSGDTGPQALVDLCEGALAQAKRIGGDSIVSQDWIA